MPNLSQLIEEARIRVAAMDGVDKGSEVTRLGPRVAIRTVITALQNGILQNDWSPVADSVVMLEQIESALRVMP
jgi:hypothetical protein